METKRWYNHIGKINKTKMKNLFKPSRLIFKDQPETPKDVPALLEEMQSTAESEEQLYGQITDLEKQAKTLKYRQEHLKWQIERIIEEDKTMSPDLLHTLAQDYRFKYAVLDHPNTSVETLNFLLGQAIKSNDSSEAEWIAAHPNATAKMFELIYEKFCKDYHSFEVGRAVTQHPHTPPNILAKFAYDEDESARGHLAKNPNTPAETLHKLALDEKNDEFLLASVVENPNASLETLIICYERGIKFGSEKEEQLGIRGEWSRNKGEYILSNLAQNQNTPPELLRKLAKSELDYIIRQYVAENPNTPAETIQELAKDPHQFVRMSAQEHPKYKAE